MDTQSVYPRGTVTFLFTDLEGSTRRWQDHPATMGKVLAAHDAILHREVAAHGGVVFKTVGDAFYAAFGSAPDALTAALDAQRSLRAEAWGEVGPQRVRMAVHTGEAEQRDGDYFGQPLNRVARLLAAGHGGQVLVSAATYELVRDHLPVETSLRDLGEHRLRDLYRPEHVFQVLHPVLPREFPPIRSLDARPSNLPPQPTPFLGREREVAQLTELLGRDGVRLVTLTGPGGIGKTRLVLQAAADLLDNFPDGAWFVDLSPLADPELIVPTVTRALGVQEEPGRGHMESLKDHLRGRKLLLVLDNFEQVTAAAPLVAEMLAACPQLKVAVTSRSALHLRAEREFPVPPLSLPDPRRLPPLQQLSQYEAVRLFIERASAVKPDFAVDNANAPAIAEICVRLDGLPLAIELAAARSKLLAPQAMLARLQNRLKLLTGGARDLPTRQQTLRGAIAWSHDLLLPEEQALFRRLAIFVGGCDVEAAETVCNQDGELDLFEGLASLVDKSLVRQQDGPDGEPRFSMLETIREYGIEQLAGSGEEETTRRAHAEWCRALVEVAAPELWGVEPGRWLDRLETEIDNLRAAVAWALERGDAETALALGVRLEKFWEVRGYLREGRRWLEQGLALPLEGIRPERRAQALSNAGNLAQVQGDLAGARALQEQALAILQDLDSEGARRGTGHVLNRLGIIALLSGEHERAADLYQEALARFRDLEEQAAVATGLNNLGVLAVDRGDYKQARALYAEALALQRKSGDTHGVATYLGNLGEVVRHEGDFPAAAASYQEALTLWAALKDRWSTTSALDGVAGLALDAGQPQAAARLFAAAAALREAVGAPLPANERAAVERDQGRLRVALKSEALTEAEEVGRNFTVEDAVAEALAVVEHLATTSPEPESEQDGRTSKQM